jgi:hypothetical protein
MLVHFNLILDEAIRIEKHRTGEGDFGNYVIAAEGENPEVLRSDGYKASTRDKGIIFFNGHGDHGGWCGGVTNWTLAQRTVQGTSFGSQHPLIIAVSCNTGNYNTPSTAELTDGLAETYLQLGAGVYIGSPEVLTADDHGSTYGQRFFRDYWRANTSIGEMFKNFERALYATGDAVWIYYVNNMNIYGDPKLGGR